MKAKKASRKASRKLTAVKKKATGKDPSSAFFPQSRFVLSRRRERAQNRVRCIPLMFPYPPGTKQKKLHGACRINGPMRADFKRYINQPKRDDISVLQKPRLLEYFRSDKAPPSWRGRKFSDTTFYRYVSSDEFKYLLPHTAPYLIPRTIEGRRVWSEKLLADYPGDTLDKLCERTIFADAAFFSDHHVEGYAVHRARYLTLREGGLRYTASIKPQTVAWHVYMGITLGDKTDVFFITDHNPPAKTKGHNNNNVNVGVVTKFLDQMDSLADRMRKRLNLQPTDPIYVIWDNAKVHVSKVMQQELADRNLESLKLPARCPECNVIETLWALYKANLKKWPLPEGENTFRQHLLEIFEKTPSDSIDNIVRSFAKRVREMAKVKGNKFRV